MPRALRYGKDVLVTVPVLWQISHLVRREGGEERTRVGEKLRKRGKHKPWENKGQYPWKLNNYTEGQGLLFKTTGAMRPPTLWFIAKIVLDTLRPLSFHMNFRMHFSSFVKNIFGILIVIALNL